MRSMARSDQSRWASIPKCAQLSSKVVSNLQHFTILRTISLAALARSVEKRALWSRFPAGSRVSAHRMGNGVEPNRYPQAVPLHSSRVRCPSPYQPIVRCCQAFWGIMEHVLA